VIEGDFTFEIEGEAPKEIKAGEASYLAPNVVHRGMNKSDAPVSSSSCASNLRTSR